MNNDYELVKNLEKLQRGEPTRFLDNKLQKFIKSKLKKQKYHIYCPYQESEKVIFYINVEPKVCLLEIVTKNELEHREILGTVFSLGLDNSMFGDIIITNNHYYIYVLDEIKNYFLDNLTKINNNYVALQEVNINTLKNYKREYLEIKLIVSSERIDTVIAHLIGINRTKVKELVKAKDILINYDILSNVSKKLEVNDIFSIRKHGKYKYLGIVKTTKNENYIVQVNKYL